MGTEDDVRPSFYALRAGGWRDYVTVIHLPYTLWNLSYVALGAALAPTFRLDRLLWGLAAFFLALGVAAHALDELHGRPLRTRIPSGVLVGMAAVALAGAVAIGIGAAAAWGWGLLVFVAIGAVGVPLYNLEIAFHNEWGLALLWGAFPVLTGFFVEAQTIRFEAVAAAAYGAILIMAQRTLSTPARHARRTVGTTAGTEPLERALRLMCWASVALGIAAVAARLR